MPPRTSFSKLALTLGLLAALLLFSAPARADVAPLSGLSGSTLTTIQTNSVFMESEKVVITLARMNFETPYISDGEIETLGAGVVADFYFVNLESAPQTLTVGFPLYLSLSKDNYDYNYFFKMRNLRAYVDGKELPTKEVIVDGSKWAAWQMTFQPDYNIVRVTYDMPATTDGCNAEIGYILHTGAAWAGSIVQADVIVRFGYPAEEMFVSPTGIYLGPTSPGYVVEDSDLRWHFDRFEPTTQDDIALTFVEPSCWRGVLSARSAVAAGADAQNYRGLAKTYADIVYPHHGFNGAAIAQAAEALYRKAIELDPGNDGLRREFAGFLFDQAGYLLPAERALEGDAYYREAITANPGDEDLRAEFDRMIRWYAWALPEANLATDAAMLTRIAAGTPTPTQTTAPTATPKPTRTPQPTLTPSPMPAPAAAGQNVWPWFAAILIFVFAAGLWLNRRR